MKQKLHEMYHQGVDFMNRGQEHQAVQVWLQAISMLEAYNAHPATKGRRVTGTLCSCLDESVNPFGTTHTQGA